MAAQVANQNALAGANQARLQAANQMGALGQQAFGTGQAIQNQQAQQGILQQGMQQALIDAAKAQYAGYTGSPLAAHADATAAVARRLERRVGWRSWEAWPSSRRRCPPDFVGSRATRTASSASACSQSWRSF